MDWHSQDIAAVTQALGSNVAGLGNDEATHRMKQWGANELSGEGLMPSWKILWRQFTGFMTIVLMAAGVVSAFVGDHHEAIAIAAIVVLNGLLGFSQEYRAERAMAALRRLAVPMSRVRRSGRVVSIPSSQLVPGDVLLLEAGNLVPADCRLLECVHLQLQESALTGESESVRKQPDLLQEANLPLGDRTNMAYRGTFVTAGRGVGMVTAIGMETELGKIARLIAGVSEEPTTLERRLAQAGRIMGGTAICVVIVIFSMGLLRGENLHLLLLTAVSIGVAAVPEGLPAVVTIALTLGAQRMLNRHVLVRRLAAVESLGSITVICTDKTGTLTENRMKVERIEWAGDAADLPEDADIVTVGDEARLLLAGAALCNDAILDGGIGDPTEVALLEAAAMFGLVQSDLKRDWPRVAEIPFDSARKRMTTLHEHHGSRRDWSPDWSAMVVTKGAVDELLKLSDAIWRKGQPEPMTRSWVARIENANEQLAGRGMRVLGLAARQWNGELEGAEKNLVFVGMLGILDPPRKEAAHSVARCQAAGIRGVMITGDHPLTARSIASQIGMTEGSGVLTGPQLDALEGDDLEGLGSSTNVFARVNPVHKLKIVEALQRSGEIVAMTGDGVNDAPALRKADIGIAMGLAGTDVAREAADIVLLDDNFASIVAAVEEGRIIYDNVRKFLKYILATNTGEIVLMLAAPVAGMPLPLLPLQILWMNLVTDGLPALALGVEPAEANVMRRNPRRPGENIFGRGLGWHIAWVGLLMGLLCLATGYWFWSRGLEQWQTILFTTMTFAQMAHVMAIRSEEDSLFRIGVWTNPSLVGAVALTMFLQLALIYVPSLQRIFSTRSLSGLELGVSCAAAMVVFLFVEIEKRIRRSGRAQPASRPSL